MQYQNFQSLEDLHEMLENKQLITGKFLCKYDSQAFYDINCSDKIFKNCIIVKGSFLSTQFVRCIFDNVVFRETEFITCFIDCEFRDCIFSNVDSGFTMENTKVDNFSQFFEEERIMEYHIKRMEEKCLKIK